MYPLTKKLKLGGLIMLATGILLVAACKNPANGNDPGVPDTPDKNSLNAKIAEAEALLDELNALPVSIDGTEIDTNTYWVISGDKWALQLAIENAQYIADSPNATASEISDALEELTNAYDKARNAKKLGTKGDKSTLITKIGEAQALFDSLKVSEDGIDVDTDKYWVISGDKEALGAAIEAAQGIANLPNAAASQIELAYIALTEAIDAINEAKNLGTKPIDKSELRAKIVEAEALAALLETSDNNGDDIPPNKEWVTDLVKSRLTDAIQAAGDVANDADATIEEVNDALAELTDAYNEAAGAKQPGTTPDKTELIAKINDALIAMEDVNPSDNNGSEYRVDEYWVTTDVWNALEGALTAAEQARDNTNATKNAVDAALADLITALDEFDPQPGKSVADKDQLIALIREAAAKMNDVYESDNGNEIYDTDYWVTAAEKEALVAVLSQARALEGNDLAEQDDVDDMVTILQAAIDEFNPQKGKKAVGLLIFDYNFVLPGDETITLTAEQAISQKKNESLHVTVSETFATYQWIVDGTINGATGNSITLAARSLSASTHTVTLKVTTAGGVPYTKTLFFTVKGE